MTKGSFKNDPWSRVAIVGIVLLVLVYRIFLLGPNELSWDVFGYYVPLPATFIHHDPLLRDIGWIHSLLAERPITETLYQITGAPDGQPLYFFLFGMAMLYLPFFLLGHGIAALTGQPMDGFSLPYQYSIAVGAVAYTWVALVHWRRILLHFFPDRLSAVVLMLLTLGTNWYHFMTMKNLETANALFMLMAVLVWNTIQWHRTQKVRNVVWVAVALAMITLVKPSEVLSVFIPLLWGVHDRASAKAKWDLLWHERRQVFLLIGVGLLVVAPQMVYWMIRVGRPIHDSYNNPGVGLDLWHPHVLDVLFSYKKGWLLYTPIMLFAVVGFIPFYRAQRALFFALTAYCLLAFWIIASWSEWWYGASFSVRPMITLYVLLSIPFGYCLLAIARLRMWQRIPLFTLLPILAFFNLFQIWQFHAGIMDTYRTTKAYYWATFGRTSIPEGAQQLKSVEHDFSGAKPFTDEANYRYLLVERMDFERSVGDHPDRVQADTLLHSDVFRLDGDLEFSPTVRARYGSIANTDHTWVRVSVRMFMPEGFEGEPPVLVFAMERREGSYAYRAEAPPLDALPGKWCTVTFDRLLAAVRSPDDGLRCYVWRRSKAPVLIDDLTVEMYLPKEE